MEEGIIKENIGMKDKQKKVPIELLEAFEYQYKLECKHKQVELLRKVIEMFVEIEKDCSDEKVLECIDAQIKKVLNLIEKTTND